MHASFDVMSNFFSPAMVIKGKQYADCCMPIVVYLCRHFLTRPPGLVKLTWKPAYVLRVFNVSISRCQMDAFQIQKARCC